ncbi:thiamine pyrophosphate-dependent enzyme [Saccharicrinis sp. FJH62]|uniref:thiamine pyrophosphate-dependent enzyme n=1 Tax=Saccharicrinis sp. FJH62 TaxID=3344657 RepID=UPI0035D4E34C
MKKLLLLGDEAIAQGALDGGLSGVYAYPGTPSTEATEYIRSNAEAIERNVHRQWAANEKTALEGALGMSYAGKRTLVCMKHVGLNVAADPYINAAVTGVNGGMLVLVADDPSMHSSQNEQDSRFYADFANLPVLEPSDQQEAYDMAYEGLALSEKFKVPVMIRVTTRLAHSRAGVERKPVKPENDMHLPDNLRQFILLPAFARKKYAELLDAQKDFTATAANSTYNKLVRGGDKTVGIIACGIAYNYLMENFPDGCPHTVFKLCHYPPPVDVINTMVEEHDELLILEEGYPLIERMVKGITNVGPKIKGRLDGTIPRAGELNPDIVARALGSESNKIHDIPDLVVNRPPGMCAGCSHIDTFEALIEALKPYGDGHVFSDIGCYTLGALPPFNIINSCVDMGASVTMAKGAADAGLFPSVAVIGDSTFTHSGMTGLIDAVNANSPVTIIISDNETTAMTGGQDSAGTGKLEDICQGIGVDPEHIHVVEPLKKNHDKLVGIIAEEMKYRGVSVIIARRECIQTLKRRKNQKVPQRNCHV